MPLNHQREHQGKQHVFYDTPFLPHKISLAKTYTSDTQSPDTVCDIEGRTVSSSVVAVTIPRSEISHPNERSSLAGDRHLRNSNAKCNEAGLRRT